MNARHALRYAGTIETTIFETMKILLIEDEQRIADFVCAGFKEQGFTVEHCADGNAGYERQRTATMM
jgi:CheY-like chemotaxis protein